VLATLGRPSRLAVDAWPKWHTEEDAEELGTKPMSLHHYVANGDDILEGIVDAVFGVSRFAIRRRMMMTWGAGIVAPAALVTRRQKPSSAHRGRLMRSCLVPRGATCPQFRRCVSPRWLHLWLHLPTPEALPLGKGL
jgi:hypothetical protein